MMQILNNLFVFAPRTAVLAVAAIVAIPMLPAVASAATIFDNPWIAGTGGSCVFNTTCGPTIYTTGSTFSGQLFTLSSGATLTSATFTAYNDTVTEPSSVNWLILSANGAGGLPGTLLASGNSTITTRTVIGSDFGIDIVQDGYDLPSVALGAGSYYIGLQAVSSKFGIYLASASLFSGAAESYDGGISWASGYEDSDGVAVSLNGVITVPEPASWALLIAGFGLTGAVMRRRRATSALA